MSAAYNCLLSESMTLATGIPSVVSAAKIPKISDASHLRVLVRKEVSWLRVVIIAAS